MSELSDTCNLDIKQGDAMSKKKNKFLNGSDDQVSFLIRTIHEVSEKAKKSTDIVVKDVLFTMKAQLLSHAICRYQKSSYVSVQYHAHEQGPLVYVTFKTKDRSQGSHVPFADLTGMSKYLTIRKLGNPYVFNRNELYPNVTRTTKLP